MINKKLNRLLSSVLGVALTVGIMEIPAFAADGAQAVSSYSTNATDLIANKNCIVSKGASIEKNGLKISLDKVIASKHRLMATVIVENQKAFDDIKGDSAEVLLTYGDNKYNSEGISYRRKDDKTLVINIEQENDKEEIPQKGPIRMDIVMPEYKINLGIDAEVDFTELFKNSIEKEMSVKIPECNFTVNKFESNALGTKITYTQPENSLQDRREFLTRESSALILKVGDNMYPLRVSGSYSSGNGKDDKTVLGTYETKGLTYDNVKDQKNISLIPVSCTMTSDEVEKAYKDIKGENKEDSNKETTSNVNYSKDINFSDGSKGEIYNIERNDNSLKIYCKGTTENESLLMASNMSIYYKMDDSKINDDFYDSNENIKFYKDPKEALGYVAEFDNVNKDKTIEVNCDSLIQQIDKFKVGTEIQLSK